MPQKQSSPLRWPRRSLASASLLLVLVCGCQGTKAAPEEEVHLRKLATVYGRYISKHKGAVPPSEAALKKFIQTSNLQEELSLGNLDQLFISPRDNQPYVVRYGAKSKAAIGDSQRVIAYEQEGRGGKRFVAFITTAVEEVNEERFEELVR
jgi:hypothetical protein